jgi:hypothetical protein
MRAVLLHDYGGPEKLKFEDNVPEPQISGSTVLIAAAAETTVTVAVRPPIVKVP